MLTPRAHWFYGPSAACGHVALKKQTFPPEYWNTAEAAYNTVMQDPARTSFASRSSGYHANRSYTLTVYQLAAALAALSLFQMLPALMRGSFSSVPEWARWLMLLSALQLAYFAWMAIVPDWSTVWVAAVVCAATATLYAGMLAMVLFTPSGKPVPLELDKLRFQARLWSAAMFLLWLLATYLCGRVSTSWQRRFLQGRPV